MSGDEACGARPCAQRRRRAIVAFSIGDLFHNPLPFLIRLGARQGDRNAFSPPTMSLTSMPTSSLRRTPPKHPTFSSALSRAAFRVPEPPSSTRSESGLALLLGSTLVRDMSPSVLRCRAGVSSASGHSSPKPSCEGWCASPTPLARWRGRAFTLGNEESISGCATQPNTPNICRSSARGLHLPVRQSLRPAQYPMLR